MLHRLATACRKKRLLARPGWVTISVSKQERIILGADLNGRMDGKNIEDEEIIGRYGAGTKNKEELMIVYFRKKRMELAVVNNYFKNKDKNRVT